MSACPRCNADAEDHVVAGRAVVVCGACGHLGPLDAPPAPAATSFPPAGQEGRVVRYTERGFGFIHASGSSRDLFFHISDVLDRDIGEPQAGEEVGFETALGERGMKAVAVRRLPRITSRTSDPPSVEPTPSAATIPEFAPDLDEFDEDEHDGTADDDPTRGGDITRCPTCGGALELRTADAPGMDVPALICIDADCGGRRPLRAMDSATCRACGAPMSYRPAGPFGPWLACTNWQQTPTKAKCSGVPLADALPRGSGAHRPLPDPSAEQRAILESAINGADMVIRALAGTGKTSTLEMVARALPEKEILYIVFNREMKREALTRFGANVDVRTAHNLAFHATGTTVERVRARATPKEIADLLECDGFATSPDGAIPALTPLQVAELARAATRRFAKSTDTEISTRHVVLRGGPNRPPPDGDPGGHETLAKHVIPFAQRLWQLYATPGHPLGYDGHHDVYLKLWQLSRPRIDADVIMFDEAQDADPVMSAVMLDQAHAQVIYCGDSYQSIYEWRGAVDALNQFVEDRRDRRDAPREHWLTESFRFGPPIAAEAQRLLELLQCEETIKGASGHRSSVDRVRWPDCVVCRTNIGVMRNVAMALNDGLMPHIAGDRLASGLKKMASAAIALQRGDRVDHSILREFPSWSDAVEWAYREEQELDPDASSIRAVAEIGAQEVLNLLRRCAPSPQGADVTITTVHQSKGKEWDDVRLADDFKHPQDLIAMGRHEDLRIAYVAVTRAKRRLDLGRGLWRADRTQAGT
jgi:cold shock CspA family protein